MFRGFEKDDKFRQRNFRGARIEDLYIYLEILSNSPLDAEQVIETAQRFIEREFNYKPRFKDF